MPITKEIKDRGEVDLLVDSLTTISKKSAQITAVEFENTAGVRGVLDSHSIPYSFGTRNGGLVVKQSGLKGLSEVIKKYNTPVPEL